MTIWKPSYETSWFNGVFKSAYKPHLEHQLFTYGESASNLFIKTRAAAAQATVQSDEC